jgi:hypothetical protein
VREVRERSTIVKAARGEGGGWREGKGNVSKKRDKGEMWKEMEREVIQEKTVRGESREGRTR